MTFCFELGKTRFRAAEESGRDSVQMKLRVSESEAVHFFEPGKFCFVLRWSIMKALSSHFIMLNAVGKHFIVDEAHTTRGLRKQSFLLFVRIKTKTIGPIHCGHLFSILL